MYGEYNFHYLLVPLISAIEQKAAHGLNGRSLNSNLLSRKIENITQLPDGNKAKLISIGGTEIDVGSTGGKIPSWSFGIFLPSSGASDACLLCFNATQITAAYKSNDIWVSCKKINME